MSKANINSDDYYQVLGLGGGASDAEIAKAYKKLALKHHPDKNPNRKEQAEEEFKKLTEACDVLRSIEKRKIYDQYGKAGLDGNCGNPQSGEPSSSFGGGGRPANMSREDADMIFSSLFGGANPFGDAHSSGGPRFVFTRAAPSNGGAFAGLGSSGMNFGGGFSHPSGGRKRPSSRRAGSRPQKSRRVGERFQQAIIPNATKVVVLGLTKSPQHNGKIGHVVSWDGNRARYEVQLMLGDEVAGVGDENLGLLPQNITQLCTVEVTGLVKKPELNGSRGEIQTIDASKHRYMVLLDDAGVSFALNPANCILSPGTCVTIYGLSNPEYNGQRAQILSIDCAAARYSVGCENGKQIKIKYQNVLS